MLGQSVQNTPVKCFKIDKKHLLRSKSTVCEWCAQAITEWLWVWSLLLLVAAMYCELCVLAVEAATVWTDNFFWSAFH